MAGASLFCIPQRRWMMHCRAAIPQVSGVVAQRRRHRSSPRLDVRLFVCLCVLAGTVAFLPRAAIVFFLLCVLGLLLFSLHSQTLSGAPVRILYYLRASAFHISSVAHTAERTPHTARRSRLLAASASRNSVSDSALRKGDSGWPAGRPPCCFSLARGRHELPPFLLNKNTVWHCVTSLELVRIIQVVRLMFWSRFEY